MDRDFAKRFSLAGRTVLITGTSSGIGAHLSRIAVRAGARVVLAARRVERLEQVAKDIEWESGQALSVALDVTDGASVEAAFDTAEAHFGVIDVVLNNAGIGNGQRPLEIGEEDWRAMLAPTSTVSGALLRSQRSGWLKQDVAAASSILPRYLVYVSAPAIAITGTSNS